MKPIVIALSFIMLCLAPGWAETQPDTFVEVLYFHGKQRCATCKAIEAYTREVIDESFARQVKEQKVKFREIDLSTPEGEKLADRYRVSRSSLFINGWNEGIEQRNDLTLFAFQNARSNTALFKQKIRETIIQLLK
ncbi:MAG TPA: thioredoxin [Candidatus Barnesiella excrementavium]|nr:thioredoxin [Candidatus Barnesiella excrementavium]